MKILLSVLLFLAFSLSSALYASPCQGLKMKKCNAKASCSWVKGYKRQGKKIKGHCRIGKSKKAAKKRKTTKKVNSKKVAKQVKVKKAKKAKKVRQ